MAEGRATTPFGEEVPIGAARKRAILECGPIHPDIDRIIAEYAQLTARDKIDMLCDTPTGYINLRNFRDFYGGHRLILDVFVNWSPNPLNSRSKLFWLSWTDHPKRSQYLDLSRFVYLCKSREHNSAASRGYICGACRCIFDVNMRYLDERTRGCNPEMPGINYSYVFHDRTWYDETREMFMVALNTVTAKIL